MVSGRYTALSAEHASARCELIAGDMLSCGQGVYRGADPAKALSKALEAADDQPPQEKSPGSLARDQPRCLTA